MIFLLHHNDSQLHFDLGVPVGTNRKGTGIPFLCARHILGVLIKTFAFALIPSPIPPFRHN